MIYHTNGIVSIPALSVGTKTGVIDCKKGVMSTHLHVPHWGKKSRNNFANQNPTGNFCAEFLHLTSD
jgi:hypothetical protein